MRVGTIQGDVNFPFAKKIWFELVVLNFLFLTNILNVLLSMTQGRCLSIFERSCTPIWMTWISQFLIAGLISAYALLLFFVYLDDHYDRPLIFNSMGFPVERRHLKLKEETIYAIEMRNMAGRNPPAYEDIEEFEEYHDWETNVPHKKLGFMGAEGLWND